MNRTMPIWGALLITLLPGTTQAGEHRHGTAPRSNTAHATTPAMVGEYVENKGQWPDRVLYRADFGVTALFAERDRLTFSKWEDGAPEKVHDMQHQGTEVTADVVLHGHAWYLHFLGSSAGVQLERNGPSSDYFNYFIGSDPANWASNVHHFAEVRYRQLWPGVDLRLYDQQGAFKYDVELDRADRVDQVRFTYEGLDGLRLTADGHLQLITSVGELVESKPVAWYADGSHEPVACSFVLDGNTVGFRLAPSTDLSRPVVIDPLLIASTLSGTGNIGTTQNYGHTATYDADGNIYTGAICFGQGYPTTPGAFDSTYGSGGGGWGVDIAVSKLNPTGSNLLFATYLGGDGGDYPHSLVVTPAGELTVYGSSDSNNYPTANAFDATFNGGMADIVVSKLNTTGTALIGSTYVGTNGSDGRNTLTSNYGDSYRGEILSDAAGRIYIASCSNSSGFPTTAGAFQSAHAGGQDGVVFCLSPDLGSMVWATYLGTSSEDMCFGIKLNSMGEPYVCGGTSGGTFPTTAGVVQPASAGGDDAFVAHLSNDATALLSATYFGTSGEDIAFFLQLDLDDDVYIYGQSPDGSLPIQPVGTYGTAGGSIFVAGFNADLSTQVFSTTLGPASGGWGSAMVPVAFLVDVCYNIYISGYSVGTGWATTPGALYASGGFYLAVYEENMGNLIYGTYYEGAGHVDGGTSRFDANGIVYQAVCTSGPFPTTPTAYSNDQPAGWDVGVFKIDFQVAGVNAAGASTLNQGCAPISIDFSNASSGDTWIWDFGDGSAPVEAFEPSHTYLVPGDYIVTLIALDSLACNLADTTYLPITIGQQQPIEASLTWEQVANCEVLQITANNTSTGEPIDHIWDMGDGTTYETDAVEHTYSTPGDYDILLIAFDPTGCSDADTVVVPITIAPLEFEFDVPDKVICDDAVAVLDASAIAGEYLWNTGQTTSTITVDELGTYWVTVSNAAGCVGTDTVQVLPAPDHVLAVQVTTCPGVPIELTIPLANAQQYLWSTGSSQRSILAPGEPQTYGFMVVDEFGCPHADTARVEVLDPYALMFAPNAFTPDGDGINDVFRISGFGEKNAELAIYNRWGEQLFVTNDPARGWDGIFKGGPVKNDLYVYQLSYRSICDNQLTKTIGHVTVVR